MVEDIRKTSYKAFNKDMTCRDFQYEVGKEYEIEGQGIEMCLHGFHSCLMPFEVIWYYDVFKSRFAEVEYWGNIECENGTTKICSSNIKVVRELSFDELLERQITWIKGHYTTKFLSDKGLEKQRLYSTACCAKIESSGYNCAIVSTNIGSKITSNNGYCTIVSQGRHDKIVSSGEHCFICSLGKFATITTSGFKCDVYSSSDYANIVSSGKYCRVDSQGYFATITCIGEGAFVRAKMGSIITIANYSLHADMDNEIIDCVRTEKVDGERIKANTWYKVRCGEFVEVEC